MKENYDAYLSEIYKIKRYLEHKFDGINSADVKFLENEWLSNLEINRDKQIIKQLENIANIVKSMCKTELSFKKHKFIDIKRSIDKINEYLAEPLSVFPDVSIWFLCNKEPVGICTIKSHDLIWSKHDFRRGSICNQMVYTDIKVFLLRN